MFQFQVDRSFCGRQNDFDDFGCAWYLVDFCDILKRELSSITRIMRSISDLPHEHVKEQLAETVTMCMPLLRVYLTE